MKTTKLYTFLGITLCAIATTFAQEGNRPSSNYAAQRATDVQQMNIVDVRVSPQQAGVKKSTSSKAVGAAQLINYQGAARDGSGELITNQSITVDVDMLDGSGGTSFFSESHTVTTDDAGVFSIQVGSINSLAGANWADVEPWLSVDVNGTNVGETQVGSSPSALYSEQSSQVRLFGSGTSNPDKMIAQHSDAFPGWGIGYSDGDDTVDFMASGLKNVRVDLFNGSVDMVGSLTTDSNIAAQGNVQVNATTSAPASNTLYGNSIVKAFGKISTGGVIDSGYGITSVTNESTGVCLVEIDNAAAGTFDLVPVITTLNFSAAVETANYEEVSANSFRVRVYNASGNLTDSIFSIVVYGN